MKLGLFLGIVALTAALPSLGHADRFTDTAIEFQTHLPGAEGLNQCQLVFYKQPPAKEQVRNLLNDAMKFCVMREPRVDIMAQAFLDEDLIDSVGGYLSYDHKSGKTRFVTNDEMWSEVKKASKAK